MDISTEIAAVQAASEGNELRQPLVDALTKLNGGALPTVTVSDVGKILKVGANGWEVGEKSGYMPVPSATKQITENGTYDVTDYSSAEVSVSGEGIPTLITKNITQNGTYNASSDNADGYSSVTVNVSGSGIIEEWDLKQSATGIVRSIPLTNSNVTIGETGAVFDGQSDYLRLESCFAGITIEVDVVSMNLTSGTHRRFIMATETSGLIYRSTGKWSFYGGNSWAADTNITDGSFFDNSTVKVVIDSSGYWHIYKNNVLVYEPTIPLSPSKIWIGSSSTSINNAVISGLRIY